MAGHISDLIHAWCWTAEDSQPLRSIVSLTANSWKARHRSLRCLNGGLRRLNYETATPPPTSVKA